MGLDEPSAAWLTVSVAYGAQAEAVDEVVLRLAAGSTVNDALRESGLAQRHPALAIDTMPCGVWGRLCARDTVLRDRDRVEIYRPLQVDPKEARRRRQRAQRTPAAKAGKSQEVG